MDWRLGVPIASIAVLLAGVALGGDPGSTGVGDPAESGGGTASISVQEEGVGVTNTPHETFNFVGAGVTATDGGASVATITIPGGTFSGDLAGADLSDSTDQAVGIAATDVLEWVSATTLDGSTDGTLVVDTAAGGGYTTLTLGTGTAAIELQGAGSVLTIDATGANASVVVTTNLTIKTNGTDEESQLDDELQLPGTGNGYGSVCWDDEATGPITCVIDLGSKYYNTTAHFLVANTGSWAGDGTNPTATFRMGDMDAGEGDRTRSACNSLTTGIINCDTDLAGNDDTGLCDICVMENTGGAYTHRWAGIADMYAEVKWVSDATTTTPTGDAWVDVLGGAADETAGWDIATAALTAQVASAGRWMAWLSICYSTASTGSEEYEFSIERDISGGGTEQECIIHRDIGTGSANKVGCGSTACIIDVANDDKLAVQVWQTTDSDDVVIEAGSMVLRRL